MEEIVVTNLGKTFGAKEILKSVSFSVAQGEFVALVGPSGAGKSTLLNLLGLLDEPSTGEIRLHGNLLPKINSKKATLIRREQINYLFQSFALISNETVFQNLWLAMNFVHQSSSDKKSAIHEVLARLGISDLQNELVNTLSGGEQQRVAIARHPKTW